MAFAFMWLSAGANGGALKRTTVFAGAARGCFDGRLFFWGFFSGNEWLRR